ncbi:MAG TPA: glycosyltransferase family A protein [Verrucomicrobiae bacterium]|jgi:glycosyltransferase involved in cell wall biosynthesis|nr:glycosyltransferase family A protein [Verrucomicrobiae bacterium]
MTARSNSLGVLIPTRNSAALLPAHLESMAEWIDLADEIVVVDSASRDGTLELLRQALAGRPARFLAHPPGLYQSWNFGLQNIGAKYVYISTIGDAITRPGLEHLRQLAAQTPCDAVLSKPRFVTEAGEPAPEQRWPIDDVFERLTFPESVVLTPADQLIFSLTNLHGALLGSSASNLYRTACLRERPFPVDFGTVGDGAWVMQNMLDVRLVATRGRFSTFRFHEKSYSLADYQVDSLSLKLFRLAQQSLRQRAADPRVAQWLQELRWPELEAAMEISFADHACLESHRHKSIPWFFHGAAWRARARRNDAENLIRAIKDEILARRSVAA